MWKRTDALTKLEQKLGKADGLAPFEPVLRIRWAFTLFCCRRLDLLQIPCHLPRQVLVHANRSQHGVHLTLHLAVTRALYPRLGRAAEVAVMVALRLGCEEAADAHRNCTGDELGNAAENDQFGLAKGRKACSEGEGDGEAV